MNPTFIVVGVVLAVLLRRHLVVLLASGIVVSAVAGVGFSALNDAPLVSSFGIALANLAVGIAVTLVIAALVGRFRRASPHTPRNV